MFLKIVDLVFKVKPSTSYIQKKNKNTKKITNTIMFT